MTEPSSPENETPSQAELAACMRDCWGLITANMAKEDFFAASAVAIQELLRIRAQRTRHTSDSVSEYLADYEFRFDGGGGHVPTDSERAMLEDAIEGYMSCLEGMGVPAKAAEGSRPDLPEGERPSPRAQQMREPSWRCFHCDAVFTDKAEATLHFGDHLQGDPACKLNAMEGGLLKLVRDQESELQRFRSEETASYREFYSLGAEHSQALRREEEKGYARGLKDASFTSPEWASGASSSGGSSHDAASIQPQRMPLDPCPYDHDGPECLLETYAVGPCLCALSRPECGDAT